MLIHLDFWAVWSSLNSKSYQNRNQSVTYRLWTVDAQSKVPSLRTVRFILTALPKFGILKLAFKSAMCNPDWPSICHPCLLGEDVQDGVLYHCFPLGWVVQTEAAIMPQDLWNKCWTGCNITWEWPEVYEAEITKLVRTMNEAEDKERERRKVQWRAQHGGEGSGSKSRSSDPDSEWSSSNDDDSDLEEEGDDGDESPDEHATDAMSKVIEETSGSEELQDVQIPHEDQTGEQPQQVAGEQAE